MKKLISGVLAGLMLAGASLPVTADDAAVLILTESSHLVLTDKYVDMIDGIPTVAELKANFAGAVDVADKKDTELVATDDTVSAGEQSLKALIYGDVNRDAKINVTDVTKTLQYIAKWQVEINTDAADVDKNTFVNVADVTKLLKSVAGWSDISLGNVRMVFENKKVEAENESADLDLYFESSLRKIGKSDTKNTGYNSYKIRLAKNESESCQFFISSSKSMEGMTVEMTPFEHEYGEGTIASEILIHYYYEMEVREHVLIENAPEIVNTDLYPEPLLPLADSFELKEGTSQGFHINVKSDESTPAGMYKALLTVRDADGNAVKCANVYTYVWDFTLPVTPYSASAFSINWWNIYTFTPDVSGGDDSATYKKYYDFLLDNNITAYSLPYSITDPRADEYMSDPRVTYFTIRGGDNIVTTAQTDEETVAFYEKVQTNPVWADKAAFYLVDEPYGESGAQIVRDKYTALTELLGTDDYQSIMPHGNSMVDYVNNIDVTEFIKDWVSIMVPHTRAFQPTLTTNHYNEVQPWTPRQAFLKYGESADRYHAMKYEGGKKLWWYVCVDPEFPYPNLFSTYQGVMSRVLWWQQFMYDVDGFLYWSVNSGWENLPGKHRHDFPGNGDGLLIYCGDSYGRTGPVLGWRLIQVRDGFDDFDYLRMAEELVGTEKVIKIVKRLTTGITEVREDEDILIALRDEIASIIVENQK